MRSTVQSVLIGIITILFAALNSAAVPSKGSTQHKTPKIVAHSAPLLHVDKREFKDLNKNGKLDPYEDWRLPAKIRAADLLKRMTVEEKTGLMMHASNDGFIGPYGKLLSQPESLSTTQAPVAQTRFGAIPGISASDRPSPEELILKLNVRWIAVKFSDLQPDTAARWSNTVQGLAEGSRLGIPVVLSSDPFHTTHRKAGGALQPAIKLPASRWPDQIGFGAIGDPAVVRKFGEIAAAEYRALGLRVTIAPMADVATEPRWNRIPGTFGSDANLNAKLTEAFIRGFQGNHLGPTSVMCITKHFPGDGPVKNGFDPHNSYGKYLAYPAHNADYHLLPFKAAIAAGTGAIMPSYGIPMGKDTVGVNFSKKLVTGLLRNQLGFQGIVITDWLRAMPWGVEELSQQEREHRLLNAGVDQLGGEHDPSFIINLVKQGIVPESRLDASVTRILLVMFKLGLFENPYVDPARAKKIVGAASFAASGEDAQRKAIVLLRNRNQLLPLKPGTRVYAGNIDPLAMGKYAPVAADPAKADVLLLKINSPYVSHKGEGNFFKETHEGTLAYAGSDNEEDLRRIRKLRAYGKPLIVVVSMERPAVLSDLISDTQGILATFGSGDQALAEIVFGKERPVGKLPFDLPRDMNSVLHHKEDAAHDLRNPLFPFGFGLTYAKR